MRAHGRALGDAAILDLVDTLSRESSGAGPLDVLVNQPGVTDVLVNGPDQVFVDPAMGCSRRAWPSPTTPRCAGWPNDWRPQADVASTTPTRSSTCVFPTAPGCMRCSRRWHGRARC